MIKTFVTWDLGATKCAAGVVEFNTETQHFQCLKRCAIKLIDTVSLEDLISSIENALDFSMSDAHAICISAAGIYDGHHLNLVNAYPYSMPFALLAEKLAWPPFAVIHDYAPIICATFSSYMDTPANLKRLNHADSQPYERRLAIGVGTGLGLKDGVLLTDGDFWLGQNEAGHIGISLPPQCDAITHERHEALMHFLAEDTQPISFEKILSGQGTVRLHQFFYPAVSKPTPEQVGVAMRAGDANETLKAFAWYLGLYIGAMQLAFMPAGGIWLTGGVILHHLAAFDCPEFQAGIVASPAYLKEREQFALGVLLNPDHALIGGAYYAAKRLLIL